MVVLPIAIFAVVLFVYNRLSGDRELVVMRACGMGQWDCPSRPDPAGGITLFPMP
jgi:lipopolysaccharide export LptBFGC system permease protein LptF